MVYNMMAPFRWGASGMMATDDVVESDEAVSDDEGIEGFSVSLLDSIWMRPARKTAILFYRASPLLWLSIPFDCRDKDGIVEGAIACIIEISKEPSINLEWKFCEKFDPAFLFV